MSYDYLLVKTTKPIEHLRELDEKVIVEFGEEDRDGLVELISRFLPGMKWETNSEYVRGEGGRLNSGRFRIGIHRRPFPRDALDRPYQVINIHGSFNSDQRDVVTRLAKKIGFTALDVQTGDVLWTQCVFDKSR